MVWSCFWNRRRLVEFTTEPASVSNTVNIRYTHSATLLKIDLICSHCALEMPESVLDRVYMSKSPSDQYSSVVIRGLPPLTRSIGSKLR